MLRIDNIEAIKQFSPSWRPLDIAYIKRIVWSDGDVDILTYSQERQRDKAWPDSTGDFLEIDFKFVAASDFRIAFDSIGLPQHVAGFDIVDVSNNGMERIKFEIEDYENGIIRFGCQQIIVEQVRMIQEKMFP